MRKSKKLLIIGIDGGTWRILKPAIDKGYMPFLKSQVENGASGILESTMPSNSATAWSSFQTGLNPSKHCVFDFVAWDKKTKRKQLVSSQFLRRTIWDAVSDAGRRVGVVNVPMTYPPKPINGYMITGILTPSLMSNFTYPPKLKFELFKAVPDYHIFNLDNIEKNSPHGRFKFKVFIHHMIASLENRSKAAQFIIEKGPLDVFMVHFQAVDVIQHVLWCFLDENHPLYDQKKQNYIFEYFYGQLDQKIQEVHDSFSRMTHGEFLTLIVSDHGFQIHKKRFNLGNWLYQDGFFKLNAKALQKPWFVRWIKKLDVFKLYRHHVLQNLRSKVARPSQQNRKDPFYWNISRTYPVGTCNEGFIYLLEEEFKREETIAELIKKLSAIKDPEDGTPVASHIYRKEEIFSGKYLDLMPDLILEPSDGYSFTGPYQPNAGLFHIVNIKDDFHIGKHHKDGILVVVGEAVKQQDKIRAQIIDIVPTILYYLKLRIPRYADGRVLKELFTENI